MIHAEFWSWFDGYVAPLLSRGNPKMNRVNTIRLMLQHLDKFPCPVIVETGCIEEADNWVGNGCSTLIFDKYVSMCGGTLFSVDIVQEKVVNARKYMGARSTVVCDDSIAFLTRFNQSPHLVYLDASQLSWHVETEAQVHHWSELKAIMPRLTPDTLVVVDDSPAVVDEQLRLEVMGKGGLVAKYAEELGVELVFAEYQAGWIGFPGRPLNDNETTEAMVGHARKCLEEGKWPQAYKLYRAVMARTPPPWNGVQRVMHGEACAFFARLALQYERWGTAHDWYRRAIEADPMATDYRLELINKIMSPMGMAQGAKIEAEKATLLAPDDPYTWRSLGLAESRLNDIPKSLVAHAKQIDLSDRSVVALLDYASTLIDVERYGEAEELCLEAIDRDEDKLRGDVYHCWAMIRARLGAHEEAIEMYEKAIALGCSDEPLLRFHLSLSQHSIGRYREGWKNLAYRSRNRTDPALYVPMRRFTKPLFAWQPAPAVVHVHAEAGAGDNICMMRYLYRIGERGYTVRYESQDALFDLMRDNLSSCGVEVVPTAKDYPGALGLREFDYHLPLGELPHLFNTDIDTVPWPGPYIVANPAKAAAYAKMKGRIGIAWSAGVREEGVWLKRYGQLKSLSFDLIRPIIDIDPSMFVSLQVGPPRAEHGGLIEDVLPDEPTWSDTAALLANLDLVITPDTGLAHLAGAMGRPTWLMMHAHNQGWHFMTARPGAMWNEQSPWYPTLRVFRGYSSLHYWHDVVADIVAELQRVRLRFVA